MDIAGDESADRLAFSTKFNINPTVPLKLLSLRFKKELFEMRLAIRMVLITTSLCLLAQKHFIRDSSAAVANDMALRSFAF